MESAFFDTTAAQPALRAFSARSARTWSTKPSVRMSESVFCPFTRSRNRKTPAPVGALRSTTEPAGGDLSEISSASFHPSALRTLRFMRRAAVSSRAWKNRSGTKMRMVSAMGGHGTEPAPDPRDLPPVASAVSSAPHGGRLPLRDLLLDREGLGARVLPARHEARRVPPPLRHAVPD